MMNNAHLYCVILAGGTGERLWPLSRTQMPKQFLKIADTTLLEQTIARVQPLVTDRSKIWISTTADYVSRIQEIVGDTRGTLVVEPCARNTGAALLYSCYKLLAHDPQAQVIFLPADAFIPVSDGELFRHDLRTAIMHMQKTERALTIVGVKPSHAATGYGYIEYADTQTTSCYTVDRFHEKPSSEVAQYYVGMSNMLWNIGVVVTRADVCVEFCKEYAPDLYQKMDKVLHGDIPYQELPSISFDYAVLEKSDAVFVVPTHISWSDVGNLNVLLSLIQTTALSARVLTSDAHNNVVHAPEKLVALIGVDDLCVIDTRDVLLIARRSQAESVKAIVAQLKQAGLSDYL